MNRHSAIIRRLFDLKDTDQVRKTHYFAGRYENIYINRDMLPDLNHVLDTAQLMAAKFLNCRFDDLKLGFWFNLMYADDITLPHTHDDNDELLAATYYLQIPPQAGKLILKLKDAVRSIDPVEGQFVFFHPGVEHEVTRHLSATPRISLGINFGPKKTAEAY
ncbi:MAG: hypothetical protein GC149_09390 [Gammaproteobacteria bacterium]|nr:hypothetical protein [Gammaproteobacteria bacterium]